MQALFDLDPVTPDGFEYIPEFISDDEERLLIETVRKLSLHPMIFQGFEAKRLVESYGYDYDFSSRQLRPGKAIPVELEWLLEKTAQQLKRKAEDFAEVLVTEYPPGSVINWHRDAPPFDIIAGISLLSDCNFRFRPHEKLEQSRKSLIKLPVSRRSLYVMAGESRTNWEHSIPPVKSTRFSITLRTLRR